MSREPFDRREQNIFLRTIVLASLVACVGFTIFAMVRGDPLGVPLSCMFITLNMAGLVFGWFGKLGGNKRDGQ